MTAFIGNSYLQKTSLAQLTNWSVRYLLETSFSYNEKFDLAPIGSFLKRRRDIIHVQDEVEYQQVTVKINGNGVEERDWKFGKDIGTKRQYRASAGQFIMSKIDARNGAFGIVPEELDGAMVTNDFPVFDIDTEKILPQFFVLLTSTKEFISFAQSCSSGTTNRQRIDLEMFLNQTVPLPEKTEQIRILNIYKDFSSRAKGNRKKVSEMKLRLKSYLFEKVGLEKPKEKDINGLQFIRYKEILEWSVDNLLFNSSFDSKTYPTFSFESDSSLYEELRRGKSPVYDKNSDAIILNQKCNRWNEIKLEHARKVKKKWLDGINKNQFTKEGDILINSTGEGTIGRASYVTNEFEGLMYDSHMLLLRVNRKKLNPQFIVFLINSEYCQRQINLIKSAQSTNQTELGIGNTKKIIFPLLPLDIQNEISDKLATRYREIAELKRNAKNNDINAIIAFKDEIFRGQ
ncbi:restriction endonuclease subunit S [Gracilimonas sp.]|uniref:restriction endonuclease subunit S n=1 Tax=Gracilimonas sp. TaxID=1974203 RepID=UPI0032EAA35D